MDRGVPLVERTRHAVPKLSIYRARPVVRRKVLSADGSCGDMSEFMCTLSMLTRRSKHPLTAKRASVNGWPATSLHQTPRHTASSDASEPPCPTLQIRGETSACSRPAKLRGALTSVKTAPLRYFVPENDAQGRPWAGLAADLPGREFLSSACSRLPVLPVPAGAVATCFCW